MNVTVLFDNKISELKLSLKVLEVKELDKIYQVTLVGGNNGHANWPQYLDNLSILMSHIDCWLISIENDVPDDKHYIKIGVNKIETTGLLSIHAEEVKVIFKELYFEKYDNLKFNNGLWSVITAPVKKENGYEVTLKPLNNDFGIYDSRYKPIIN